MLGQSSQTQGFTLIELSIVLVIIGLIVGGILVGQDLIRAAGERAQITQIEKFNSATSAFFGKYGYLPGDIPQVAVTQFNFTTYPTRPGGPGCGDGNGEIDGSNDTNCNSTPSAGGYAWAEGGEELWFWQDLSSNANLIEGGGFTVNPNSQQIGAVTCTSNTACAGYYPVAKINSGASVYAYSGYAAHCCSVSLPMGFGPNFFGISVINSMNSGNVMQGAIPPAPGLTVKQAYDIDKKIDDGLPTTGNVIAQYLGGSNNAIGWSTNGSTPSASTCYDTSSGTAAYSIGYQNGALVNCGISFRMQAGD
jgi:prepilin-type N-terminal cleavage/methylation domain-containing protein